MSSDEVCRKLVAAGWILVRTKGSHRQYKHPTRPSVVTVPHPKKNLGVGLLKALEKASGVSLR